MVAIGSDYRVTGTTVINTAGRTCNFDYGLGLLGSSEYWSAIRPAGTPVALLTSQPLLDRFPEVRHALGQPQVVIVPDGEPGKSLNVVTSVYERLADTRFPRTGIIVGMGGGAVTDLAGFVAATWKRGARLVLVPTTLTGQVDAAIGGKNGVNLTDGKNIVGTIFQPERVIADRAVLGTLPDRDFRGGLAEIIKCGFVGDPVILDLVDSLPAGGPVGDDLLRELVDRSVRVKVGLVEQDEQDRGPRRYLNYGHTLGQAVEAVTGYREYNHGEAVGIGMLFAASVAAIVQGARELPERTRRYLTRVGLPTRLSATVDFERIWTLMGQDKKAGSAGREFVLCLRPGVVRLTSMPDRAVAREAFRFVAGGERGTGRD
ncbi:3-dehydroquinate synthase [Micromonospora echinospora]|uniref:3-dehydroquinate synthase n=1 Tax=Micromonospora echinospora TaxID=1877 RepID=UPI003CE78B7F